MFFLNLNIFANESCLASKEFQQEAVKIMSDVQNIEEPFGLDGEEIFGTQVREIPMKQNLNVTFSCIKGLAKGIWDSTGGQIETAAGVIKDPVTAWNNSLGAFAHFKEFLSDLQNNIRKSVEGFDQLSPEVKSSIICSLIGSIATDTIISAMVPGGVAKLMQTLASKIQSLNKIALVVSRIKELKNISKDRFDDLFKQMMNSKKELSHRDQLNFNILVNNKQSDLAIEALQCAL